MAKLRKPKSPWVVEMVPLEIAAKIAGRCCAWAGCSNVCEGDLSLDWVNVLTWWWPQPTLTIEETVFGPTCTRDAVLCGQHARELESLLTPIRPDSRLETPAGEA
jgi:hypothetical protein